MGEQVGARSKKKKTGEIEELINAYYLDEIDGQKVEDTMYTGMVAGLEDPYSVYYSKEELESMEESISGAYSGIGATLTQDPDTGELILGDIIISVDRVREQAESYGHSRKREFAFLVAHSMLHLCGYDHMEDAEREVMETRQREILAGEGYHR